MVDSDRYRDTFVHFPAHWHDEQFNGVLPKGTPIVQCVPVKRESWDIKLDTLSNEQMRQMNALTGAIGRETGVYRRQFRAGKRLTQLRVFVA